MPSLVFSAAMSFVVVGLLVGLWAWVLLPGLLRERRNASPLESVNEFERSMDTLAQTGAAEQPDGRESGRRVLVLGDPERVVSARARSRAELRRRAMLARGGFALAVATVTGLVLGDMWWIPAGVVGGAYALYVGMVVRIEQRLAQRREMLHDLSEERERRQPPSPAETDADAVELVVGDASGIIITGWRGQRSDER
jgi:hypothetical protein